MYESYEDIFNCYRRLIGWENASMAKVVGAALASILDFSSTTNADRTEIAVIDNFRENNFECDFQTTEECLAAIEALQQKLPKIYFVLNSPLKNALCKLQTMVQTAMEGKPQSYEDPHAHPPSPLGENPPLLFSLPTMICKLQTMVQTAMEGKPQSDEDPHAHPPSSPLGEPPPLLFSLQTMMSLGTQSNQIPWDTIGTGQDEDSRQNLNF